MKKTLGSLLRFGKKVIKPIAKPLLLTTAILFSGALSSKLNAQTPTWYQAFNPRNEVVFEQDKQLYFHLQHKSLSFWA